MNNLGAIKKKLMLRKTELEGGLSNLYKEKITADVVQDSGDQALFSSIEDIKISLYNTNLDEYKMIIKALEMIEAGTYGICTICGKPISEKRLMLFPTSTRCLVCQEDIEENQTR